MDTSSDPGRLWRRATGMAAFVLFLGGLLVAIDLEEVAILAGGLGLLCALAGGVTWLLVRYRGSLAHGCSGAYRVAAKGGAGAYRAAVKGGSGASRGAARGSAGAYRVAAPAVVQAERWVAAQSRSAARRAAPVLRRADDELGAAITRLARLVARTASALAADIHGHRETRSSQASPRSRRGDRPIPARSPAARRADARRSAAERRRDRA